MGLLLRETWTEKSHNDQRYRVDKIKVTDNLTTFQLPSDLKNDHEKIIFKKITYAYEQEKMI